MLGRVAGKFAKPVGTAVAGYTIDQLQKKRKDQASSDVDAGPSGQQQSQRKSGLQTGNQYLENKAKSMTPGSDANVLTEAAQNQVSKRVDLGNKTVNVITNPSQTCENLQTFGTETRQLAQTVWGAQRIATGNAQVSPHDVASVSKGAAIDVAHNSKSIVVGAVKGSFAAATTTVEIGRIMPMKIDFASLSTIAKLVNSKLCQNLGRRTPTFGVGTSQRDNAFF
ncbi:MULTISPECIES: hypothetical protein [unclassified Burkholderia]|uniref:hypothetical protein n=1 Tax=unclassified Burkholderia TaxID=2613784 RepID=UPI000B0B6B04|nr:MULTISPECIES: hypothetical protein [unclassified Burkholderia]